MTKRRLTRLLFVATLLIPTTVLALPDDIVVEEFASDFLFPIGMTSTPDGDLLVTEKLGTVRLVRDGEVLETPVLQVEPVIKNESGLLGIEILPDFETSREFVITYTPAADLNAIYLSKFRLEADGTATTVADPWLELPSRPDTDRHYGGNVQFYDGHIYIALSDLDIVHLAQDTTVLNGSILRYDLDLQIPEDNPIPGSPIWAWGLRNTFDFTITPDGTVYGGENGHHQHDEINRLESGGNYGFPVVLGRCDYYPFTEPCDGIAADMLDPVHEFKFRTAPTGIFVYQGDLMPQLQGQLFMAGWHTGELHRFDFQTDGSVEERDGQFFVPPEGIYSSYPGDDRQHLEAFGITDAIESQDGSIYVMVSGADVGKVYRIAPRDAVFDASKIREESDAERAQIDSPVCAAGGSGTPIDAPLLVVAGILLVGFLRRRSNSARAARTVATGAAVLILATPAISNAQVLDFGARAGGVVSYLAGDNGIFLEPAYGPAVGGTVRFAPIPFFGVSADLLYVLKGTAHKYADSRASLHYVTVPLMLQGILPIGPVKLRLEAGGFGNLLLAARSDGGSIDGLRTFEFTVGGGLGADIDLFVGAITIDLLFERALQTVYDEEKTPDGIFTPTNFTTAGYVLVGYLF